MAKAKSKAFERIERHICTSQSLGELVHWDGVRLTTQLQRVESAELSVLVAERAKTLTNEMFGREVVTNG